MSDYEADSEPNGASDAPREEPGSSITQPLGAQPDEGGQPAGTPPWQPPASSSWQGPGPAASRPWWMPAADPAAGAIPPGSPGTPAVAGSSAAGAPEGQAGSAGPTWGSPTSPWGGPSSGWDAGGEHSAWRGSAGPTWGATGSYPPGPPTWGGYAGGTWGTPPPPAAKPKRRTGRLVALGAAVVLVAGSLGAGLGVALADHDAASNSATPPATNRPLNPFGGGSSQSPFSGGSPSTSGGGSSSSGGGSSSSGGSRVSAVAQQVDPAVVDINTTLAGGQGAAAGTGMIVSPSGLVVTNNHVVDQASSISVTIQGRAGNYAARVVGVDPTADVAVIQIEGASGLPTVSFGNSAQVAIGARVVAIGNALGLGGTPTVTGGAVTALHRTITAGDENGGSQETLTNMIQMDAPIEPGNSGGPLVLSSNSTVIGMDTAAESANSSPVFGGVSNTPSSVAFAIPSSTIVRLLDEIRAHQSDPHIIYGSPGYLGVEVVADNSSSAAQFGESPVSGGGALIEEVIPGTPAASLGLAQGDVITAVNGQRVTTASNTSSQGLGTLLHAHRPGDRVTVTWVDQNGSHTSSVQLAAGPAL